MEPAMKKGSTIVLSLLIVRLLLFVTETEAGRKPPVTDLKIAIFDLSITFKSDAAYASTVSELLQKELAAIDSFTVLGRDEMNKVLAQYKFHHTDTTDTYNNPVSMSDIGHYIGVHRIIYGSITSVNNDYTIVLHLLNVLQGKITATVIGNLKGNNKSTDSREIQTLIKNLLEKDRYSPDEPLSEQKATGKLLVNTDRNHTEPKINGNNNENRGLIITVDSSSENSAEVELKGFTAVSVIAEPDYAHIYINGDYVGKGFVDNYSVTAGDVEIRIEAPEYVIYKTVEPIEAGKNKTIKKKLDYLFGSMQVESHPDTASLFLNGVKAGTTPYTFARLRTGTYKLRVNKNNYTGIAEDVVIKPNVALKREYTLKFTKAYRDSLRRERWLAHGARGIRRVLFCALGTVCGAAGYYFESKLEENKNKYPIWENEYDNAVGVDTKRFEEIKTKYYQEYNQAKKNKANRDVFISIAGVCGAGFFISIFF